MPLPARASVLLAHVRRILFGSVSLNHANPRRRQAGPHCHRVIPATASEVFSSLVWIIVALAFKGGVPIKSNSSDDCASESRAPLSRAGQEARCQTRRYGRDAR